MTPNSKILSVALAAAVLGGTTVALVNHSGSTKQAETAPATATLTTQPVTSNQLAADSTAPADNPTATTTQPQPSTDNQIAANTLGAKDDQTGYRQGYTQGLQDASEVPAATTTRSTVSQRTVTTAPARAATRPRYVNNTPRYSNSTERRGYYDYSQPRQQRTFWQKHRDKLTVGGGTVGGALLGGVIGGKKGAAIGALSGAGGSAIYTYKVRKKNHRY